MTVAVTGASGFLGRALTQQLAKKSIPFRGLVRTCDGAQCSDDWIAVGDMRESLDWARALRRIDVIIHCAARAHVMQETQADALAAFRAVNVEGTRRLAEQGVASGIRRLVYVSSIKVNGEQTASDRPFRHADKAAPEDAYGISKWEAEQVLWEIAARTGLEVVVVRPPLVYGPHVRGNFLRLLTWVALGLPLPLGQVTNQRSLVGLDNLTDLLVRCIDHPAASGGTFLVSDGRDLSTPELLRLVARAMARRARLIPVPPRWLEAAGKVVRQQGAVSRLLGSLRVDISHTRETLTWNPPVSVEEELQRTAEWFLQQR